MLESGGDISFGHSLNHRIAALKISIASLSLGALSEESVNNETTAQNACSTLKAADLTFRTIEDANEPDGTEAAGLLRKLMGTSDSVLKANGSWTKSILKGAAWAKRGIASMAANLTQAAQDSPLLAKLMTTGSQVSRSTDEAEDAVEANVGGGAEHAQPLKAENSFMGRMKSLREKFQGAGKKAGTLRNMLRGFRGSMSGGWAKHKFKGK
jgi:hypothetical protein